MIIAHTDEEISYIESLHYIITTDQNNVQKMFLIDAERGFVFNTINRKNEILVTGKPITGNFNISVKKNNTSREHILEVYKYIVENNKNVSSEKRSYEYSKTKFLKVFNDKTKMLDEVTSVVEFTTRGGKRYLCNDLSPIDHILQCIEPQENIYILSAFAIGEYKDNKFDFYYEELYSANINKYPVGDIIDLKEIFKG